MFGGQIAPKDGFGSPLGDMQPSTTSPTKLNLLKCLIGVTSGKFLEGLVWHRGIKVDLPKIKAIIELPPPRNTRELKHSGTPSSTATLRISVGSYQICLDNVIL